MAYHVLDVMQAIEEAAQEGAHREIESTAGRPAPLPLGLLDGALDR